MSTDNGTSQDMNVEVFAPMKKMNARPVILFREMPDTREELRVAEKYFPCYKYRTDIPVNSLVIPRYSARPYFNDLEYDIENLGSTLINDSTMHSWIANFDYYQAIAEYTPRSWEAHEIPYIDYNGPFIVKGASKSLKMNWNTHMFADSRRDLVEVAYRVGQDSGLLGERLIVREYIPLKTFEKGINGVPFSNEWRLFFYKSTLIAHGYYWTIGTDETIEKAKLTEEGLELAQTVAEIVKNYSNFFVLDIAEKEAGGWIVIEINDGMQSGLQGVDADILYKNLKERLVEHES